MSNLKSHYNAQGGKEKPEASVNLSDIEADDSRLINYSCSPQDEEFILIAQEAVERQKVIVETLNNDR